jgi:PRTRC genetic system protein A
MSDLAAIFAGLVKHHVATPACPLPDPCPGITWIWAANGVYKRGVSSEVDLLIPVGVSWPTPGLAKLLPHVRWKRWPQRLPGAFLTPLLEDAKQAAAGGIVLRPIEKQYFFVWRAGVRVVAPRGQDASAVHLRYAMPESGPVLLDLHSHHGMDAYFSGTDDRDDTGLSVSAVIGNIYTRPIIVVRINVFGQRHTVPALTVFDSLGPFVDGYAGGDNATPHD